MADVETLRTECTTLTRYLLDRDPTDHMLKKYVQAHELGVVSATIDDTLVRWARKGGAFARAADIHARFFEPRGLLRQKLVLLLGILETDPVGRAVADTASGDSFIVTLVRLTWWGTKSVTLLLLGLPFFWLARSAGGGRA